MGTRSMIAIKDSENKFRTIYCHWDGYPEHHLPILTENYSTPETVEELFALGNLSCLDENLDSCEAYHRDRNEDWEDVKPQEHSSLDTALQGSWAAYYYVFDGKEWSYGKN